MGATVEDLARARSQTEHGAAIFDSPPGSPIPPGLGLSPEAPVPADLAIIIDDVSFIP